MNLRRIIYAIIALVVVIAGFYLSGQLSRNKAIAPAPEKKMSFDPLNTSYIIEGQTVALINGSAEQEIAPGSASKMKTSVFGIPKTGDLNGDSKDDAALMLVNDSGGSGTFYYVVAALNVDGGTKGTNAILLGDRIAPQTLEIRNGAIIANYAERKPDEPMTVQPSVGVSKYLYIEGQELKEVTTSNDKLEVTEPAPFAEISSPVTVAGNSNFFEATTRIRIKDGAGNVLADTFTTADGWMDKLYPFSKNVKYDKPSSKKGTIEIFEESAMDGSEVSKAVIPVIFADQ